MLKSLLLVSVVTFSLSVRATTFTVDSLLDGVDADVADNLCDDGMGHCTLRAAIAQANAKSGTDAITFSVTGTIQPDSNLPVISDRATITGPGATSLTLDIRNASSGLRISGADAAGTVVQGLKIVNASSEAVSVESPGVTVRRMWITRDASFPAGHAQGIVVLAANATIGGVTAGDGNVIHGIEEGVLFSDAGGSTMLGNVLGLKPDGTTSSPLAEGVAIEGPDVTIGSSNSAGRNVIASSRVGIDVGETASNFKIIGNYIGTDVSGTEARGNGSGMSLNEGCSGRVGSGTPGEGNVISGSTDFGIDVISSNVSIKGNRIGTNAAGSGSIPNGVGIMVHGDEVTIGGAGSGEGNVVSGNRGTGNADTRWGVVVFGSGTRLLGNLIGTNASGTAALPNDIGVQAGLGSILGGSSHGSGNVISGNTQTGVSVVEPNVVLSGNLIGTNASGTSPIPNGSGVVLGVAATNSMVGGITPGSGNVISGNRDGLVIQGSAVIQGNIIGAGKDGITPISNDTGVLVSGSGVTVGGSSSAGNLIASNRNSGLWILSSSNRISFNTIRDNGAQAILVEQRTQGNTILSNSIDGNFFGIDDGADGADHNDPSDVDGGGNSHQNYPVITAAIGSTIRGTLNSTPNHTFTVEVFTNPAGHLQGKTLAGSKVVTSDASGNVYFEIIAAAPILPPTLVTSTATDNGTGDTSEFSAPVVALQQSTLNFASSSYTVDESAESITVTVTRSGDLSAPTSVHYATSPASATAGADYQSRSGDLSFAVGVTTKSITIPIVVDDVFEGPETFRVLLTNSDQSSVIGTTNSTTVHITDAQSEPSITIGDVTQSAAHDGATAFIFIITLSAPSASEVSVGYSTSDGTGTQATGTILSETRRERRRAVSPP